MTPEEVKVAFSWLPAEALDLYLDSYVDSGDDTVAWGVVRSDARYGQWFPGNMTEDGRPRYSEDTYAAVTASYDDIFRAVGLNPDLFRPRYGELIAGDVAPSELEDNRVMPMYERIVEASAPIRAWYADTYDLPMTTQGLLASALDPELGSQILNRQISMAEIGGEASESGFNVDTDFVDRLYDSGKVDRAEADRLFTTAENFVPVLDVLARRHDDPDDDFDLEEFVSADLFQDPTQRRRMRRLVAQEQSLFHGADGIQRDRYTGGLSGLAQI